MAASDYEIRAEGALTATGLLSSAVEPLDTVFPVTAFQSVYAEDIIVGMAALIDNEFVRVTSNVLPNIGVARGCGDTVPASHAADARIWFVRDSPPYDTREYVATETIGVKGLPFTVGGGPVPIENAPPMSLTFDWRFFRPYPPGQMQCQGEPWFTERFLVPEEETDLVLTWVHRDRLLQGDQLIDHLAAGIGPEPGTTYTARVYNDDGVLRRTVTGISGTTWTYTRAMANEDLSAGGLGYIDLHSVRDGLESQQFYRTLFEFEGEFGMLIGIFGSTEYTPPDGDDVDGVFSDTSYVPPESF